MVVYCPDCDQPLRVPEHLNNPLLRCPRCKSSFRPADLEEPEPVVDAESVDYEPEPEPEPAMADVSVSPGPTTARRDRKKAGSGLGVIGLILFILIAKAPRLLKNMFDDRPKQQPEPVRLNEEEIQELNRLFQEQGQPPEPDEVDPEELNNLNAPPR